MNNKGNKQTEYYQQRGLLFSIGLVLSCLMVITAFEWKVYDSPEIDLCEYGEEMCNIGGIPFPVEIIELPEVDHIKAFEIQEFEEKERAKGTEWLYSIFQPKVYMPEINLDDLLEGYSIECADIPEDKILPPPPAEEIRKLEDDAIICYFEENTHPKGGFKAFYQFINENIHYPALAKRLGLEGKVFIQFTVGKDGTLTNFKILKGITSMLDKEALRVLKMVPKWVPLKERGIAVEATRVVPIPFKLAR